MGQNEYLWSEGLMSLHKNSHKLMSWLGIFSDANSFPNDKLLDWSKLKVLADDKMNVNQKQKFFFEWIENIVGKGENAGYKHFFLFPQYFLKASFSGSLKVRRVKYHLFRHV